MHYFKTMRKCSYSKKQLDLRGVSCIDGSFRFVQCFDRLLFGRCELNVFRSRRIPAVTTVIVREVGRVEYVAVACIYFVSNEEVIMGWIIH